MLAPGRGRERPFLVGGHEQSDVTQAGGQACPMRIYVRLSKFLSHFLLTGNPQLFADAARAKSTTAASRALGSLGLRSSILLGRLWKGSWRRNGA
jgi:hypothetical protein